MNRNYTIPAALSGLLFLGIALLLYYSGATLAPVFFAFLLAHLLDPAVSFLEKRGVRRSIAVIAVFLALIILLGFLGAFFVNSIATEFRNVEINLNQYAGKLYELTPERLKLFLGVETQEKLNSHITAAIDNLRTLSFDVYRETFSFIQKAFASTLGLILAVLGYLITPVYLYYFLKDLPGIRGGIVALIPPRHMARFEAGAMEAQNILSGFVRGQLSVCAILAVLYSIGLYFIGIDLAVVIGTLAGVTFIIPYLGTIIGILLSMTMALLKFHDLLHPLLCLGWFLLVQLLEGGIITPKIVGDKVGLHPVVAIIAIILGGQLFGIAGMLLAVPVTAVLKVFMVHLAEYYRTTAFYRGE